MQRKRHIFSSSRASHDGAANCGLRQPKEPPHMRYPIGGCEAHTSSTLFIQMHPCYGKYLLEQYVPTIAPLVCVDCSLVLPQRRQSTKTFGALARCDFGSQVASDRSCPFQENRYSHWAPLPRWRRIASTSYSRFLSTSLKGGSSISRSNLGCQMYALNCWH